MQVFRKKYYLLLLVAFAHPASAQVSDTTGVPVKRDSIKILERVVVPMLANRPYRPTVTPLQILNGEVLKHLNAATVGDAARYFSGVQVKDYGGVGGLKTISVRSLGAAHTGILYDGIPMSDVQTGQIDLSRYSTTFVRSIELQQGSPLSLLQPARAYSYSAALSIYTPSFTTVLPTMQGWQAGLKAGSFGLWQPYGSITLNLPKRWSIGASSEAVFSKGNYPFTVENGSFSERTKRQNADLQSYQGEVNVGKMFKDSSVMQVKVWGYQSNRGLPGAIVFFNERSVQNIWNKDVYVQSHYLRSLGRVYHWEVAGRYSRNYTRYTDPDYLNGAGGLDNRYTQQEYYFTNAVSGNITNAFTVAAASDFSYSTLSANVTNFVQPTRRSFWNNVALHYGKHGWRIIGSLLLTTINDRTNTGNPAATINKLTPSIAGNWRFGPDNQFAVRAFYKHVFRMPTFNDLYYHLLGNAALRPEYARQYNVGGVFAKYISHKLHEVKLSADAYYNLVDDKIIAIPNKNLFAWTMLNLGKVDIRGIDINAELRGQIGREIYWFTRMVYTRQKAIDITSKTSATYKNLIPYTPQHSGSAMANLRYREWTTGYSLLFSGTRYTLGENNPFNELDGWGLQDVFVSWTKGLKHCKLQLRASVDNVTDKRYDVVRYFPMPGRSYKIGIQVNNL